MERGVAHEHSARRAHRKGRAKSARFVVGCHGDEHDIATTARLDKLEGHLDADGVGVVECELSVAHEGVVVRVESRWLGRVRYLLHADGDVHGLDCSRTRVVRTN